jgi:hypothetical protein
MNTPAATETFMGDVEYVASKQDGTQETVAIRQLPMKLYRKLLAVVEDESAMVELFCDKPAGWSETLTRESFEHIVTEGERLNEDFFWRWAKRQLARQEKLMPGLTDKLASALLSSPNGSPKSASNPA